MERKITICVYCGSSDRGPAAHRELAVAFGESMAASGIRLVFGGGRVGVMGALADAVMGAGGEVIGVIPNFLMRYEVGHTGLTSLEIVSTMHARKARMAELSDAFVVLPGGLGTLEELFEIVTWRQLRLHDKPIVVIDPDGYWRALADLLDGIIAAGYARPEATQLFDFVDSPAAALARLSDLPVGSTHLDAERL
jgi:uncharacterized protein (TIGR00730 family)